MVRYSYLSSHLSLFLLHCVSLCCALCVCVCSKNISVCLLSLSLQFCVQQSVHAVMNKASKCGRSVYYITGNVKKLKLKESTPVA